MGDGITWDNTELERFAGDLSTASRGAQKRAMQAVRKAAHDIQAHAQDRAPVDTGHLRGSITIADMGTAVEIGPTAHYGGYVELGTRRMAPQPYLGPAADRVLPELEKAIAEIGDLA